jgi:site-specific recombinase XerD
MPSYNSENERAKHRFLKHAKDAWGYSELTLDAFIKSIDRFEQYTRRRSFSKFHLEQARAFKAHLLEARSGRTGLPLGKSTICATLNQLKKFFHWLADEPGYRRRFRSSDADYFTPSRKDARLGAARRDPIAPTVTQMRTVVMGMPVDTDMQRRDRALVAFIATTGARVNAVRTAKLKHLNSTELEFDQDAQEVSTKFSKTQRTTFFAIGADFHQVLRDYEIWLRHEKGWMDEDPLFPATTPTLGRQPTPIKVLSRRHWKSSGPIRAIFRKAFAAAEFPYFNPHNLRHMLSRYGMEKNLSIRDFKAWSQNLGHNRVQTTLSSYGTIDRKTQAQILRAQSDMGTNGQNVLDQDIVDGIVERIRSELLSSRG